MTNDLFELTMVDFGYTYVSYTLVVVLDMYIFGFYLL